MQILILILVWQFSVRFQYALDLSLFIHRLTIT